MISITSFSVEKHTDYTGSKIGMWLFLFTEMLLFGGLFLIYSTYRAKYPISFHVAAKDLNIQIGTLNTILLLTSSLTMAISILSIKNGSRRGSASFLMITIIFGLLFLFNKYFEWGEKIAHGIYPGSEALSVIDSSIVLFYNLYFVMTGLHALHVLAGIFVLFIMFVLLLKKNINRHDFVKLENTGLYWHFVDIIWIYLFPLFYLIT